MTKKKHTADLILIIGLIAAGVILGLILLLTDQGGKIVQVRVSGNVVRSFSLKDEVRYEITGKDGGKNLLIIRDGEAWIEEADCPDKLCRNMGRIRLQGQSLVCLPHEVVVEILDDSGSSDDEVDIIVK